MKQSGLATPASSLRVLGCISSGHRDVVTVQFHQVMPKFSLLVVVGALLSPWPFFLTSALTGSCLVSCHMPCQVLAQVPPVPWLSWPHPYTPESYPFSSPRPCSQLALHFILIPQCEEFREMKLQLLWSWFVFVGSGEVCFIPYPPLCFYKILSIYHLCFVPGDGSPFQCHCGFRLGVGNWKGF